MAKQHTSWPGLIVTIPLVVVAAWACPAIRNWIRVPIIEPAVSRPTSVATMRPAASPMRIQSGTATPVSGYATTWAANTFRGGGYADEVSASLMHLQQAAADMTVLPNGTVALNHNWDEGHMYIGEYATNGTIYGQPPCSKAGYLTAGASITNNGTYMFAALNPTYSGNTSWNPPSTTWATIIGRWNLDGTAAPFSGGVGDCTNWVVIDPIRTGSLPVWGLAASSTELYVADPNGNEIKVYGIGTMSSTSVRSWSFTNPRRIAYDSATNSLWISTGTNTWLDNVTIQTLNQLFVGNIYHQTTSGTPYGGQAQPTITSVARPSGLAVHNGNLYIADDGPDQNIKIFKATTGAFVGTFGDRGGYLSGTPGVLGPTKLLRPNGVGFDRSNNMYVLGAASTLDTTIELQMPTT